MTLDSLLDVLAAVCLVLGALFSVAAGIGLIRFPDALSRMHAATKPQVLGLILVLLAIALSQRSWTVLLLLAPILLFQMMTAPVSAHMIGRAAYRADNIDEDYLYSDQLDDAIERAQAEWLIEAEAEAAAEAAAAEAEAGERGSDSPADTPH